MEKSSINQSKLADFKEIEKDRWLLFSQLCEAKLATTCILSQEYCRMERCFAIQIIKYIKGFM